MKWEEVWFNKGEKVCIALDKYGTATYDVSNLKRHEHKQFVCINPLNGTRKDSNVSSFRNILVESDCLNKEAQMELMKKLELPYSTLTDSGGKSLHFVICLKESLESESHYRQLARAILLKIGDSVDSKTFNPSRFSRLPNGIRHSNHDRVVQKLLECHDRVDNAKLLEWLGDFEYKEYTKPVVTIPNLTYCTPFVKNVLMFGDSIGQSMGRNNMIFRAACDLARQGFLQEQIEEILQVTDLEEYEYVRTIQSAFQNVTKSN